MIQKLIQQMKEDFIKALRQVMDENMKQVENLGMKIQGLDAQRSKLFEQSRWIERLINMESKPPASEKKTLLNSKEKEKVLIFDIADDIFEIIRKFGNNTAYKKRRGLNARDIQYFLHHEKNVSVSYGTVRNRIGEMLKEGRIELSNPEAIRDKRYIISHD